MHQALHLSRIRKMGQALVGIIKALQCDSCARYVCNHCTLHSKCSDCCEVDVITEEVGVQEEHSDLGVCLGTCLKGVKEEEDE